MNFMKKDAAYWEAALRDIDAKIAATRAEIEAHQAEMMAAAADEETASTVTWVKRKAKLAETEEVLLLRRQGIVKELERTRHNETVEANQARRDAQDKRTAALLKKFPEAEARMKWLADFFAECRGDEEACRLLNFEKLEGIEPIACAAQRAATRTDGDWAAFWMEASLPSLSAPYTYHWSLKAHPGRGTPPPVPAA